jgi:hypothetical protein
MILGVLQTLRHHWILNLLKAIFNTATILSGRCPKYWNNVITNFISKNLELNQGVLFGLENYNKMLYVFKLKLSFSPKNNHDKFRNITYGINLVQNHTDKKPFKEIPRKKLK